MDYRTQGEFATIKFVAAYGDKPMMALFRRPRTGKNLLLGHLRGVVVADPKTPPFWKGEGSQVAYRVPKTEGDKRFYVGLIIRPYYRKLAEVKPKRTEWFEELDSVGAG